MKRSSRFVAMAVSSLLLLASAVLQGAAQESSYVDCFFDSLTSPLGIMGAARQMVALEATGDGVDDLLIGVVSSAESGSDYWQLLLLEGPLDVETQVQKHLIERELPAETVTARFSPGDFNGDDLLDVFLTLVVRAGFDPQGAALLDSEVLFYEGVDIHQFAEPISMMGSDSVVSCVSMAEVADMDGDGVADLISLDPCGGRIRLVLGSPSGVAAFSHRVLQLAEHTPLSFALGRDGSTGQLNLAVAALHRDSAASGSTPLDYGLFVLALPDFLSGPAIPPIASEPLVRLHSASIPTLQLVDLDSDAVLDLVFMTSHSISWIGSINDAELEEIAVRELFEVATLTGEFRASDVNLDGFPDLVVVSQLPSEIELILTSSCSLTDVNCTATSISWAVPITAWTAQDSADDSDAVLLFCTEGCDVSGEPLQESCSSLHMVLDCE